MELTTEGAHAEVIHGADHIVKAHEICSPNEAEDDGAEERADESLYRLLWGEFDEGSATKRDAPDVGEDVVTDDERGGNPEPDEALEDVVHDEVTAMECQH